MPLTEVFTGAHGALTLANEETPEGEDAKAVVDLYQVQTVARVRDVTLRVDTDLKGFYEIGRRHAVSLSPGDIHISGSVGRAYVNGALLFLLLGRGVNPNSVAEPYVQPAFNMTITASDPARPGTSVALELGGVKFQNWSYSMPEDDFVLEDLDFKALTIRVLDREEDGPPLAPEFAES